MTEKHNRRSIRLKDYDYSHTGLYFVTICKEDKLPLFGNIENGKMIHNQYGKIIKDSWLSLPSRFPNIKLDQFVIMPNHLHGIIIIFDKDTVGAIHELPLLDKQKIKDNYRKLRRSMLLPKIIGYFKMNTAKSINKSLDTNYKLWQRNYYEHIIRDERDFYNTRQYIFYNPLKWAWDKENPNRIK